jgi:hypothetical protein
MVKDKWNIIMLSIGISMILILHPKVKFVNLSSTTVDGKTKSLSNNATISSLNVSNLMVKKLKNFH